MGIIAMPVQLNVGLSRKIGQPNFGSRGASLNLEVELDASAIDAPDRLRERIKQLYGLMKVSIDDELGATEPGCIVGERPAGAAQRAVASTTSPALAAPAARSGMRHPGRCGPCGPLPGASRSICHDCCRNASVRTVPMN
jgi:hypothetical protein